MRLEAEASLEDSTKLKLMVVHNELHNLELLYITLRRDFQVFKADGALSALEILETEGEMAVIISKQRMPFMKGAEFLSRTVEPFPDTIGIILINYTEVEDLVEPINSGKVFKYITNPWHPKNVIAVAQQAADTYRVVKRRTNELRQLLLTERLLASIPRFLSLGLSIEQVAEALGLDIEQVKKAANASGSSER
jgi:response regulator RpfG family c-di-GMP phosphodiesterase